MLSYKINLDFLLWSNKKLVGSFTGLAPKTFIRLGPTLSFRKKMNKTVAILNGGLIMGGWYWLAI